VSDAAWALQQARQVGPIAPPKAEARPIPKKLHTGPLHSTVAGRTDHLPSNVPNGAYVLPADIVSGFGEGNTTAGFKVAKRMFDGANRHYSGTPYAGDNGPYGQGAGPYGMARGGSAGSPYTFSNDVTGASRGETYGAILAKHSPSNTNVGYIQYGASPQQTRIHDIQVHPDHRRNGVAASMMDHLKSEFPHNKINWGMTTPEGEKFKRAYYQRAIGGEVHNQQDHVPVAVAGGEHVISPQEVAWAGMGDMDAGHRALDDFVLRQRKLLIKTLKKLPGPKRGNE
jgi:ribosomal protein S18 acetylase RimI-like enzyme